MWAIFCIYIVIFIISIISSIYEFRNAKEVDGKEPFLWEDYPPND